MNAASARTARYRNRQKNDVIVLRIEVNAYDLADALIATGLITEAETRDRNKVEAAANEVMVDWVNGWADYLNDVHASLGGHHRRLYNSRDVLDLDL